jgi:hypothetical protein
VRRKLCGVIHRSSVGSAARSALRMLASDIHPPSRLANTGPLGPVSAMSAVNASTPNAGNVTVCGGLSPFLVSCRWMGIPGIRWWSTSVPANVTVGGSARRSTSLHRSASTSLGLPPVACGGFVDDVLAGRLSHAVQPQLDAAVEGARKRPIGDAGAFGWDRRDGMVFVAPLVAATLARFSAATAGRRLGRACFAQARPPKRRSGAPTFVAAGPLTAPDLGRGDHLTAPGYDG